MLFNWKREAVSISEDDPERSLDQKLFDLRCRVLDFIELPFCLIGIAFGFIRRNLWNS